MKFTKNLNLGKPQLSDSIQSTINQLSENFEILDNFSDVYVNEIPLDGVIYPKGKKFWKINPDIGDYIGWINIREGQSVSIWQPNTFYNVGEKIKTTNDNSHVYIVASSGTSSPLEPDFKVAGASLTKDLKNVDTWTSNFYYEVNEIVIPPNDNGYYYVCTVEGNAGNVQPTWKTNDGEQVMDGNISWIAHKILTWQESGISANFRPWGKIE